MPPIITTIFKFWLFITWHCRDDIRLVNRVYSCFSTRIRFMWGNPMIEYVAHGRGVFVARGKKRDGGCDLPVPGAPGDKRCAVQVPEHELELICYG
jgi:hypothetical protein